MNAIDPPNRSAAASATDPLFVIDNTPYTQQDCLAAAERFRQYPALRNPTSVRLAVCLQDTFEWLALCLYLRDHGGSVLPIHPGTPKAAARELADKTACSHLVYGKAITTETLEPVRQGPPTGPEGGELIQLSSGTTGTPKTIARRWADINRELDSYNTTFTKAVGLTPILACPVTHSYGLICGFLAGLLRGRAPQVITNLNPRFILGKLKATPDALLYASPTLIGLLLRMLPAGQGFHTVMVSGATLPAPLLEELKARSQRVCQQYGCSEVGCIAVAAELDEANTLGTPLPHLTVTTGASADAPEEIRAHVGGRTIHTRDLGYLDRQGQLRFLARMDDTINVAGINVYPGEVEDVFLRHPDIHEAIAYKKPDSYAGERVCLRFVARRELDTEALRRWGRDLLSAHQLPVELQQVEQIPRLANGKVSRRQLAEASQHQTAAETTGPETGAQP